MYANGKHNVKYVHALVASTFLGERPGGCEINHVDGIRSNNRLENLAYMTHLENVRHSRNVLKTHAHGERHGHSRLTEDQVRSMFKMRATGATYKEIGSAFGVVFQHAHAVINGARWQHITPSTPDSKDAS